MDQRPGEGAQSDKQVDVAPPASSPKLTNSKAGSCKGSPRPIVTGAGKKTSLRKTRVMLSVDVPKYELNSTPSMRDGLSTDTEMDLRIWLCQFIQDTGILLKQPQVVMACAQILVQRFYYRVSMVSSNVKATAIACLFLAAKVEESQRRLRDTIHTAFYVEQKVSKKCLEVGAEIQFIGSNGFSKFKNDLIKAERRVLKELGFCVHLKHPHKLIISYLNLLELSRNTELAQIAWNYMNDGLRTSVFIRFKIETIACACIHLGTIELNIPMAEWWPAFDVSTIDLEECCRTILALYIRPKRYFSDMDRELQRCSDIKHGRAPAITTKPSTTTPPAATTATPSPRDGSINPDSSDDERSSLPITPPKVHNQRRGSPLVPLDDTVAVKPPQRPSSLGENSSSTSSTSLLPTTTTTMTTTTTAMAMTTTTTTTKVGHTNSNANAHRRDRDLDRDDLGRSGSGTTKKQGGSPRRRSRSPSRRSSQGVSQSGDQHSRRSRSRSPRSRSRSRSPTQRSRDRDRDRNRPRDRERDRDRERERDRDRDRDRERDRERDRDRERERGGRSGQERARDRFGSRSNSLKDVSSSSSTTSTSAKDARDRRDRR